MAFFHSNFMLQIQDHEQHINHPSPILQNQEFHGEVASLLGKRPPEMAFSGVEEMTGAAAGDEDLSDDGLQIGEKKRRLNMEQVRTLEKNFEVGNKLEPDRKMQLARALGLQPRQVAIWFQNRRARCKTKQLEKDYEVLKRQYDAVKAENDALQKHNQKLHAQILSMKSREPTESINLNKETEGSCSNRSENSSEIKLDISRTRAIDSPISKAAGRPFFPSSLRPNAAAHQLFLNSSRPEIPCSKMDQNVKEESLCNMFCGMDDQTGFWPWLDQQQFN